MSSEYYVANNCICIGRNARSPFDECIVIGADATSTTPRQLVIGTVIRDLTADELRGLHSATSSLAPLAEAMSAARKNCDEAIRLLTEQTLISPWGSGR